MDQKVDAIGRLPIFAKLSKRDLEALAANSEEIDEPAGKVLAAQGTYATEFFVIVSGAVSVERDGQHLRDLGPGDHFGELSLLAHIPRTATVTCTAPDPAHHAGQPGVRRAPHGPPGHRELPAPRGRAAARRAGDRPGPLARAAVGPTGPSAHAVSGVDRHRPIDGRGDAGRDVDRGEGVADGVVRPGFGEDEAADRAVGQDERAAAVPAVDRRPAARRCRGGPCPARRCRAPSPDRRRRRRPGRPSARRRPDSPGPPRPRHAPGRRTRSATGRRGGPGRAGRRRRGRGRTGRPSRRAGRRPSR